MSEMTDPMAAGPSDTRCEHEPPCRYFWRPCGGTPAEPGAGDVERDRLAMALVDIDPDPCDPIEFDAPAYYRDFATALLASDWLRDREDAARREGGAKALDEAAGTLWAIFLRLPNTPSPLGDMVQRKYNEFRDRATAARSTR